MDEEELHEIVERLSRNRPLAHETLFKARHPNATPEFHAELINLWHGNRPNICFIAFRGSGKSTLSEEGLVIKTVLHEFENAIIFGASFDLAAQRLHAVRREFEKNEELLQIFGDLRSQPWADDKLEFTNGVVIQAMGRGQSMRGTKEETKRPDFILLDDIEDRESVRTPEARKKVGDWLFGDVIPAGDYKPVVRMLANDLHPECIPNQLKNPDSDFLVKVYPWEYLDAGGERRATWPGRFPLEFIDKKRLQLYALGRAAEYAQEYMCQSEVQDDKPFRIQDFRIVPRVRSWEGTYAMFDPARTVGANSALTGWAVWSWIGTKLIVWEAGGKKLLPNEIVSKVFEVFKEFNCVEVGVEEDGLNQFLLQPLRHEATKRRILLPLKPMKAPNGKNDFIRGLQPFFLAHEVEFTRDLPELKGQLLSFPSGLKDIPNALAYALKMRPGAPVYEDFGLRHVAEELQCLESRTAFIVLNATRSYTTGALVQALDGTVRIYRDWAREGSPGEIVGDIIREARLEAGQDVTPLIGPQHYDKYTNVGLQQAIARIPMEVRRGGPYDAGKAEIRRLLQKDSRDMPALLVSSRARWTLNALSGGYARLVNPQGMIVDFAEEGIYRTLMEGVENFTSTMKFQSSEQDYSPNYAYTKEGTRYLTSAPHLRSR